MGLGHFCVCTNRHGSRGACRDTRAEDCKSQTGKIAITARAHSVIDTLDAQVALVTGESNAHIRLAVLYLCLSKLGDK